MERRPASRGEQAEVAVAAAVIDGPTGSLQQREHLGFAEVVEEAEAASAIPAGRSAGLRVRASTRRPDDTVADDQAARHGRGRAKDGCGIMEKLQNVEKYGDVVGAFGKPAVVQVDDISAFGKCDEIGRLVAATGRQNPGQRHGAGADVEHAGARQE